MNCARCDHKESDHCKGNVEHVHGYKSNKEYAITCVGRHCKQTLCSCVAFVKPEENAA